MSYTSNLAIAELSATQDQKEVTINDGLEQLDNAANAVLPVSFAAGTGVQLTAAQFTHVQTFRCQGLTAASTLTVPASSRAFCVRNEGGFNLTVGGPSGAGVVLAANTAGLLQNTGADVLLLGVAATQGDGGVLSVAGRGGAVTLAVADVAGAAPIDSPGFTGTTIAPILVANSVAAQGDNRFVIEQQGRWVTSFDSNGGTADSSLLIRSGTAAAVLAVESSNSNADLLLSAKGQGHIVLVSALSSLGNNRVAIVQQGVLVASFDAGDGGGAPGNSSMLVRSNHDSILFAIENPDADANLVLQPKGAGTVLLGNVPPPSDSGNSAVSAAWVKAQGYAAGGSGPSAGGSAVTSVAGRRGDVVLQATDIGGTLDYSQLPASLLSVPIAFVMPGKPAAGQVMQVPIVTPLTIPANLAGSVDTDGVQTTANATFTLSKISHGSGSVATIGTITIGPGGSGPDTTAYSPQAAVGLVPGDILRLTAPSPQDATLADVGITILAQRT